MENFILYSLFLVAGGALILLVIGGYNFKGIILKLCRGLDWRHHVKVAGDILHDELDAEARAKYAGWKPEDPENNIYPLQMYDARCGGWPKSSEPLKGLHEPTPETFYQGPPAGVQVTCHRGHEWLAEEPKPGFFKGGCPVCGSISNKPNNGPPSIEEIGGEYPKFKVSGRGKMVCHIADKWFTDNQTPTIKGFVSLTASGVLLFELNDYYDVETLKHNFGNIEFTAIDYKKPGELAPAHDWLVKSFLISNWVLENGPPATKAESRLSKYTDEMFKVLSFFDNETITGDDIAAAVQLVQKIKANK